MKNMAFVTIVVMLLAISCNPAPESSDAKLTINGTEVSSVSWINGQVGTVVYNFGVSESLARSLTKEQQRGMLFSGPWYFWQSSVQEEMVINYSDFPGKWDDQKHGLYFTTQPYMDGMANIDSDGNVQITLVKGEKIEPSEFSDGKLVYYYSENTTSYLADDISMCMMVSTPYTEGTFLIFKDIEDIFSLPY